MGGDAIKHLQEQKTGIQSRIDPTISSKLHELRLDIWKEKIILTTLLKAAKDSATAVSFICTKYNWYSCY